MNHYKDIRSSILNQYQTDDRKIMWLLNNYNRNLIINTMLDCIEIMNDDCQAAASIRSNLNHWDYNILNSHKKLNSKGQIEAQQTLLWAIMPIDAGGLEEDLNISQLNTLNKALPKFGFGQIVFKRGTELNRLQMKARMDELRFMRKHQDDLMNTNHFDSLF